MKIEIKSKKGLSTILSISVDKKTIEKKLSNPKLGYAKLDENGKVQRDADGNRVELAPLVDKAGDVILSCGNLQQKIAEIEVMLDGDFVIFAVTPEGYERMAANLQEIKRYINQQKEII